MNSSKISFNNIDSSYARESFVAHIEPPRIQFCERKSVIFKDTGFCYSSVVIGTSFSAKKVRVSVPRVKPHQSDNSSVLNFHNPRPYKKREIVEKKNLSSCRALRQLISHHSHTRGEFSELEYSSEHQRSMISLSELLSLKKLQ